MTDHASTPPPYTLYHPRWYRRRVSVWWWLGKPVYAAFVLRELSSVAVAFFALVTLLQLRAIGRGPEAYARFLARLRLPSMIALDAVALLFVLFHAITWFNLAPKAMVVRFGGKRVGDALIVAANYAAWFVASLMVGGILLGMR
jgi:fumarate reductase subunit C